MVDVDAIVSILFFGFVVAASILFLFFVFLFNFFLWYDRRKTEIPIA